MLPPGAKADGVHDPDVAGSERATFGIHNRWNDLPNSIAADTREDARTETGWKATVRNGLTRIFVGDWHPILRDPLDLVRLSFPVGALIFAGETPSTSSASSGGTTTRVHITLPMSLAPILYIGFSRLDVVPDPVRARRQQVGAARDGADHRLPRVTAASFYEIYEWVVDNWFGQHLFIGETDTVTDLADGFLGAGIGGLFLATWAARALHEPPLSRIERSERMIWLASAGRSAQVDRVGEQPEPPVDPRLDTVGPGFADLESSFAERSRRSPRPSRRTLTSAALGRRSRSTASAGRRSAPIATSSPSPHSAHSRAPWAGATNGQCSQAAPARSAASDRGAIGVEVAGQRPLAEEWVRSSLKVRRCATGDRTVPRKRIPLWWSSSPPIAGTRRRADSGPSSAR